MEDVLCETGCLAVSRVSCELELCGRLWEFELNSGVTHGHKLRSDGGGGKRGVGYIRTHPTSRGSNYVMLSYNATPH